MTDIGCAGRRFSGLMHNERRSDLDESEGELRPVSRPISFIIWRYFLLCGAIAVLSGYVALVGTFAEEFSRQIIWVLSYTLIVLTVLALILGIIAIGLRGLVQRKSSGRVARVSARIFSDLIVGSCALWLLLFSLGSGIALMQLSIGQFLLGDEEIQYRHLMMLSAYAGALFGITAGWKSKLSYGLGWATSIWHGARVFLEAAFLAYAGLWLSKGPFEYAATQAKEAHWEIVAITSLGVVLIFAGSLSLMGRQSQMRPEVTENVEQVPFRTKVRQQIQDLKRALSATKSAAKKLLVSLRK